MQQKFGILVESWPAVLGSDFSGVVTEVGEDSTRLKKGDYVYGCALIGRNDYTPFQETFIVDEDIVFKKGEKFSHEEASTIGAGLLVRSIPIRVPF